MQATTSLNDGPVSFPVTAKRSSRYSRPASTCCSSASAFRAEVTVAASKGTGGDEEKSPSRAERRREAEAGESEWEASAVAENADSGGEEKK
jgi:hypothetical protein